MLLLPRAQVQSLVRELKSCKPQHSKINTMLQPSSKLSRGKREEALSSLSTPSDTRQSLASTRRKGRRLRKTHYQGPGSQALPKAEGPSGESRTPPFLPQTQHTQRAPSTAQSCCRQLPVKQNIIQATQNTK